MGWGGGQERRESAHAREREQDLHERHGEVGSAVGAVEMLPLWLDEHLFAGIVRVPVRARARVHARRCREMTCERKCGAVQVSTMLSVFRCGAGAPALPASASRQARQERVYAMGHGLRNSFSTWQEGSSGGIRPPFRQWMSRRPSVARPHDTRRRTP
jgi:hypothetical protein